MNFEEKIKELRKIAEILEDKNTTLDDGLNEYERAVSIIEDCLTILETNKGKYTEIQNRLNKLAEKPIENR